MPQRSTGPTQEQRLAVWKRSGGYCERCGGDAETGPVSIHHRKPRRMGGTKDPEINSLSNLLLLCGSGTTGCHGWVESHRNEAVEAGFLLWGIQRAEDVPVFLKQQGFYLLLPDGTYGDVADDS